MVSNNPYSKVEIINAARSYVDLGKVEEASVSDLMLYNLERVSLLAVMSAPFARREIQLYHLEKVGNSYRLPGNFLFAIGNRFYERTGNYFIPRSGYSTFRYVANVVEEGDFDIHFVDVLIWGLALRYAMQEPLSEKASYIEKFDMKREIGIKEYKASYGYSEPPRVYQQHYPHGMGNTGGW